MVSISWISGAGSTVVFMGNICKIYARSKRLSGKRRTLLSVYVSKAQAYGITTKETLSVNELHRRLGHVSHEHARLLVKKGLIEGVELEEVSEVVVCESCEWAKGERKLVQKVREGERCTALKMRSIPICGDQHLSSHLTTNATMSASWMITAGTLI